MSKSGAELAAERVERAVAAMHGTESAAITAVHLLGLLVIELAHVADGIAIAADQITGAISRAAENLQRR